MNRCYSFTQDGIYIYLKTTQFLAIHLQRNVVINQVILSNSGFKEIYITLHRYQICGY